jgi:NADH:ubiquinone oxidoreductase subunit H
LNLLSLVLIEILAERVATNVAANVQKRAGSMRAGSTGIIMVDDEAFVLREN